ncbi:hypothetical protein HDV05_004949 [Chytridiales sp. JEL 0842]|nr:hypothetical protein HDV05_004949 [Chytridiales sp. JEL 0842]
MAIGKLPPDPPKNVQRVPHIPQVSSWDCGLTCLSMVFVALESQGALRLPPPAQPSSSSSSIPFRLFNSHPASTSSTTTSVHNIATLPIAAAATVPPSTPPPFSIWSSISSYYHWSTHSGPSKSMQQISSTSQPPMIQSVFADPRYLRSSFASTQSVWTIDLAYLLRHFGVEDFTYYTSHIGVNWQYSSNQFYKDSINADQRRVHALFAAAHDSNVRVVPMILSIDDMRRFLISGRYSLLMLVDLNKLNCGVCKKKQKAGIGLGSSTTLGGIGSIRRLKSAEAFSVSKPSTEGQERGLKRKLNWMTGSCCPDELDANVHEDDLQSRCPTSCFPVFKGNPKVGSWATQQPQTEHVSSPPAALSADWSERHLSPPADISLRNSDDDMSIEEDAKPSGQHDSFSILGMLQSILAVAPVVKSDSTPKTNQQVITSPDTEVSHPMDATESTPLLEGIDGDNEERPNETPQLLSILPPVNWLVGWLGIHGQSAVPQQAKPAHEAGLESSSSGPLASTLPNSSHLVSNTPNNTPRAGRSPQKQISENDHYLSSFLPPTLPGSFKGSTNTGFKPHPPSTNVPQSPVSSLLGHASYDSTIPNTPPALRHRTSISSLPDTPSNSPAMSNAIVNRDFSPSKIPIIGALLGSPSKTSSPQRSASATIGGRLDNSWDLDVEYNFEAVSNNGLIKPPADVGVRGTLGESLSRSSTPSRDVSDKPTKLRSGSAIQIATSSTHLTPDSKTNNNAPPSSPKQVSPSRNYFKIQMRRPSNAAMNLPQKPTHSPQRKLSLPLSFTNTPNSQHTNALGGGVPSVTSLKAANQSLISNDLSGKFNSGRRSSTSTPPPSVPYNPPQGPSFWGGSPRNSISIGGTTPNTSSKEYAEEFAGHYVLFVGYDPDTDGFLYRDPGTLEPLCIMDADDLERARSSPGTDHDVVVIRTSL